MAIFNKCIESRVSEQVLYFQKIGMYPYFRSIESGQGAEVLVAGNKMLMLGSNSYLGLTDDLRVIDAANEATSRYGAGNAGSRFLNGTLRIHEELEAKIAALLEREACLLFSTGYQTNLGVISALAGPDDVIVTDKADHASIVDGCALSRGQMRRFRHQDIEHLEQVLAAVPKGKGILVIVDGVYSMEGDIADLPAIVPIARRYGARIMVDDAHAIGVIGREGRGTVSHFVELGEIQAADVDIVTGTFSKSLATIGGFCVCSSEVARYLRHTARSMIFSASLPPGCVGAASKAIDIMLEEPERIERLWMNARMMLRGFRELGFDTGASETPIIPLIIGGMEDVFQLWSFLSQKGLFVNPVVPPAVAPGECLIRTSFMATHTEEQLQWALDVFREIKREQVIA